VVVPAVPPLVSVVACATTDTGGNEKSVMAPSTRLRYLLLG
jgi:hypothetical protein